MWKYSRNMHKLFNVTAFTCGTASKHILRLKSNSILEFSVRPSNVSPICRFSSGVPSESKERIQGLVGKNKVVVFIKGVPDSPKCGFSNAVVQILRMHGVQYDSHDVLEDEKLRQGIKDYSNWPTIPQVYMNGEFIGGCDLLLQLHQSGDLIEELQKVGIRSLLLDREQNKK